MVRLLALATCLFATGAALSLEGKKKRSRARDPILALQGCYGLDCVERYAFLDDGAFGWELVSQTHGHGWIKYTVKMISQTWLAEFIKGHDGLMHHTLTIVVPDNLSSNPEQQPWASLFINEAPWLAEEMARRTGVVSACLSDVPRNFVDLTSDNRGPLDEETLKAVGFVNFAKHSRHPEWPIEMPGTKATVKAMDAMQALLSDHVPWATPSRFIISGASKRGMIAYLTALVDPRVKALNPVIITLDTNEVSMLRRQALGPEGETVYDREGADTVLVGEAGARVEAIVSPLDYAPRLTMPKLLLNCGNDDWFPPDQLGLWWERLPSPKSFYLFPNSPHTGIEMEAVTKLSNGNDFLDAVDAWVNGLVMDKQEPELSWNVDQITGEISVQLLSNHTVSSVHLWKAETANGETRDFRHVRWNSELLDPSKRHWQVTPRPSPGRWQAMLVSFMFPGPKPGGTEWRRSTEVSVMPKLLPFQSLDNISQRLARNVSLPGFTLGSPAI